MILSGFVVTAGFEYKGMEKAYRDLRRVEKMQTGLHPN